MGAFGSNFRQAPCRMGSDSISVSLILFFFVGCTGVPQPKNYPFLSGTATPPPMGEVTVRPLAGRDGGDSGPLSNPVPAILTEGVHSRLITQTALQEGSGEPSAIQDLDRVSPPANLPQPVLENEKNKKTGENESLPREGRQIRTDQRLSFDEVINSVLLNDPKLMAGFQAVNQANADALTASLVPNPTVLADVLMLPLTRPFTPQKTGGPPQQDVMLSYPIDWFVFGKRAAEMAAASEMVKISEAEFSNLIRIRVTEGAVAFYDVLETKALLALARQNIEVLARVEGVIARAVEIGGRPKVDLNRIRLDLLQNRQTMRDAETVLVASKARLRALIGRHDRDPDFDIQGTLEKELMVEILDPAQAYDQAIENRPDVLAMRLKIVKAEAGVMVEERKKYPDLVPMLGWTRQYQVAAMGVPDASSWNASVTASLPLFNRNQGNRAKAASLASQTKIEYEATLVALRAEIETAAQELKAARNNANAAATEQIQLANEVLNSITTAYEAGGRPLVDMLDAQRNFRETNRSFITMRAAYWRALYRYWSAIGKQIHQP